MNRSSQGEKIQGIIYNVRAKRPKDKSVAKKEKTSGLLESAPLLVDVDVDVGFEELSLPVVALAGLREGANPDVSFCAQGWFQKMKGSAMKLVYAFFIKLRYFPSVSP